MDKYVFECFSKLQFIMQQSAMNEIFKIHVIVMKTTFI